MSEFSVDAFGEILSRVPLESLLRFRLVCRAWRRIIGNPAFSRSHVRHHIGEDQILLRNKSGNILFKLSVNSLCYSEGLYSEIPIKWIKAKDLEISIHPGFSRISPVATCDGLILFCDQHHVPTALWNPLTREYLGLPPLIDEITITSPKDGIPSLGLGYDDVNDDYKVARVSQICEGGIYMLKTLVFSLKLDGWRRIKDFTNCHVPCLEPGVFVNGEVHWIANVGHREESIESIIALNLSTETYHVVPLPSVLPSPWLLEKKLDVMSGCLFLSYFNGNGYLDGWMMKSFGGINSWSKLFSISDLADVGIKGSLKPIAYLKSKDLVLIQHDQNEFIWLDIEKKTSKKVVINGLRKHSVSLVYQESIVRLNESGRVNGVRIPDPVKRKSLKLSLSTSNVWNHLDVWEV